MYFFNYSIFKFFIKKRLLRFAKIGVVNNFSHNKFYINIYYIFRKKINSSVKMLKLTVIFMTLVCLFVATSAKPCVDVNN